MSDPTRGLHRRRFLTGALGVGAGAALTACTSNEPAAPAGGPAVPPAPAAGAAEPGTPVTIGFSAPAADHGWIAAIANNAQAQAEQFPDVTFEAVNPTNDIAQQIAAVLLQQRVAAGTSRQRGLRGGGTPASTATSIPGSPSARPSPAAAAGPTT